MALFSRANDVTNLFTTILNKRTNLFHTDSNQAIGPVIIITTDELTITFKIVPNTLGTITINDDAPINITVASQTITIPKTVGSYATYNYNIKVKDNFWLKKYPSTVREESETIASRIQNCIKQNNL